MLLRMYLRWAERHGFVATVMDSMPGEEAGIKSATVRVEGENAYGLLNTESGVHRLVRISLFDRCAAAHFVRIRIRTLKLTTALKLT